MPYVTYLLIGLNVLFSLYGFSSPLVIQKYIFNVGAVLNRKEYYRIFTAAFLHADYFHLIFNMYALYSFGSIMEAGIRDTDGIVVLKGLGSLKFSILYVGALMFGKMLALLAHRQHSHYSAYGASGAVMGVVFSYIVMSPNSGISMFFILDMPSWVFGILYLAISIYGVRAKTGNIGHEAHLGGALGGMLIYLIYQPNKLMESPLIVVGLIVPIIALAVAIYLKPKWFRSPLDKASSGNFRVIEPERGRKSRTDDKITATRNPKSELQHELDSYLEKIKKFGYDGLSKEEKERMKRLGELLGKD
jgi:membrane associated rhomboid family serine protease